MADDNNLNLQSCRTTQPRRPSPPAAAPAPEPEPGMDSDAGGETEIIRTARDLEAVFDISRAGLGRARQGDHAGQPAPKARPWRGRELDRKVGEAVDIYVNNRLVARGEVVIVDERLGVTMTEIIKSDTK